MLPPQAVKSILVWKAKMVRAKVTPAVMPTWGWGGQGQGGGGGGYSYRDEDGVDFVIGGDCPQHDALADCMDKSV